MRTILIIVIF